MPARSAPISAADLDYQDRLARFLENHDEPRAATAFPWPRHQAAAIVTYLAPGLRFFHQGQFEGARVHVPMHLRRGPVEAADAGIAAFYDRLLAVLRRRTAFRDGAWSLVAPRPAWAGNPTWQDFVALPGAHAGRRLRTSSSSTTPITRRNAACALPFAGLRAAGASVSSM